MTDHIRMKEDKCPVCKYAFDCASSVKGDHIPKEGDFTLCFKCGTVLVFGPEMKVRLAEVEDLMKVPYEVASQIARAQYHIRTFQAQKN